MSRWNLPTTAEVCGQSFAIRSDFRAVLDALAALQDEELPPLARRMACLQILYPRWQALPDAAQAFEQAMAFINLGQPPQDIAPRGTPVVDWQQDAQLIAPAVDGVLGYSCRQCAYLHWWDFVGAYRNIRSEGLFSTVVRIRLKKKQGRRLEKEELDFMRENPDLIRPPRPRTEQEKRLLAMLGE